MSAQYEACFSISGSDGLTGVNLLREVTERIKSELLSSTVDAAADEYASDVETGSTEASGYTRISAERNYPNAPQYRVRLEVRLCTSDDGLEVEINSRFQSITDAPPPEFLAGPPRLFQFITQEFQCSVGPERIGRRFCEISVAEAESFAVESILNPHRRLPILALSEDRRGNRALDPERAQRALLGVATARQMPEELIDVNDFHNIISDNGAYFTDSKNLAWNLRQIKDVRNKAAHPPPGGIDDDYVQDGLSRIAEALEAIGAKQELLEVARLRDRVNPN
jgi:hypothetical protein